MNEEIKEITSSLKEIMNKYPNRQLEILLYVFGRDNLMQIINEPTYEDLKEEIENLNHIIDKQDRDITTISRGNKKLKSVLDEIREYIEKHKTEWIDKKFDKHNVMVKFNEYANPQAIIDMIDKVQL